MRLLRRTLAGLGVAVLTACGSPAPADPTPAHSFRPGDSGIEGSTSQIASPSAGSRATVDVTAAGAAATPPRAVATPGATVTVTRAPRPTTDDGTRTLRIPAQGISAAVFDCPTKNGVVEPPPMVEDVCWWTGSRPLGSTEGVSIVVGHSTRSTTSTGALERTRELPLGSRVTLAGQAWTVAQIEVDVDKHGLPDWVTYATGPRMLGLITCDLSNHASNVLVRLMPAT